MQPPSSIDPNMSRSQVSALNAIQNNARSRARRLQPISIRPWLGQSNSLSIGKCPAERSIRSTHVRRSSTSRTVASDGRSLVTRVKNIALGTALVLSFALGYYYITDTRAGIHQWIVVPSLRWIYDDAEDAHEAGTKALKGLYDFGIHPRERGTLDSSGDLGVEVSSPLFFAWKDNDGSKMLIRFLVTRYVIR